MTELAEKLKSEILQLAEEERAELAYLLLQSLDDESKDDVQFAWETELEQRWQEMQTGAVAGVAADTVFSEMRRKYP